MYSLPQSREFSHTVKATLLKRNYFAQVFVFITSNNWNLYKANIFRNAFLSLLPLKHITLYSLQVFLQFIMQNNEVLKFCKHHFQSIHKNIYVFLQMPHISCGVHEAFLMSPMLWFYSFS